MDSIVLLILRTYAFFGNSRRVLTALYLILIIVLCLTCVSSVLHIYVTRPDRCISNAWDGQWSAITAYTVTSAELAHDRHNRISFPKLSFCCILRTVSLTTNLVFSAVRKCSINCYWMPERLTRLSLFIIRSRGPLGDAHRVWCDCIHPYYRQMEPAPEGHTRAPWRVWKVVGYFGSGRAHCSRWCVRSHLGFTS